MGGMRGKVRGKTKTQTWIEFKKIIKEVRPGPALGLYIDFPRTKKEGMTDMEWDAAAKEWVLRYHFGK